MTAAQTPEFRVFPLHLGRTWMVLRNSFQVREAEPQSKPTCVLGKAVRSLGKAVSFSSDQFVRDLGVGHGLRGLRFCQAARKHQNKSVSHWPVWFWLPVYFFEEQLKPNPIWIHLNLIYVLQKVI